MCMKDKTQTGGTNMKNEFEIGTQFNNRGRICTITDVLKTYNSKGELVRTRYVATHHLMGNSVTDCDVVPTTIAIALAA